MGATKGDCEFASAHASVIDADFSIRLGTFDNWTGRIDKEELARAGFTYTGPGDKVVCPSCGLKLLNWTPTDNPLYEHAKRRHLCPFINSTYKQLRLNKPPKHPQYQELQARLDSFVGWPARYVPKTAEELSAAGFFYIGSADRVTCFQCGITLRDWEEEHDPVGEHRRYSEHCQFINNTDLDQLGVNTRTSNHHEDDNNRNTTDDDDKRADRAPSTHSRCGVNNQTSGIACESSLNTGKQFESQTEATEMNQASVGKAKTEDPDVTRENAGPTSASHLAGTSKVAELLAEENRRLKARRTCKLCKSATVSILFLPCGHLVTCSECAPEVVDCITCGKKILGTVQIYF